LEDLKFHCGDIGTIAALRRRFSYVAPRFNQRRFYTMKNILKSKGFRTLSFATMLGGVTLLSGGTANAQISIGIRIGPPPPPRVVRVFPSRPGPDYIFIQGYWYPVGNHYQWRDGYWIRAPFPGAFWVEPRYEQGRYIAGYWGRPDRRDFDRHDNGRRPNNDRGRDEGWRDDRGRGRDRN
jgi:YXWGXW repeat-containing protein